MDDTNSKSIDLVKLAIRSADGWKNLVEAIKASPDPKVAKEKVLIILKAIAKDNIVDMPDDNTGQNLSVPLYDMLVSTLDNYSNKD